MKTYRFASVCSILAIALIVGFQAGNTEGDDASPTRKERRFSGRDFYVASGGKSQRVRITEYDARIWKDSERYGQTIFIDLAIRYRRGVDASSGHFSLDLIVNDKGVARTKRFYVFCDKGSNPSSESVAIALPDFTIEGITSFKLGTAQAHTGLNDCPG